MGFVSKLCSVPLFLVYFCTSVHMYYMQARGHISFFQSPRVLSSRTVVDRPNNQLNSIQINRINQSKYTPHTQSLSLNCNSTPRERPRRHVVRVDQRAEERGKQREEDAEAHDRQHGPDPRELRS